VKQDLKKIFHLVYCYMSMDMKSQVSMDMKSCFCTIWSEAQLRLEVLEIPSNKVVGSLASMNSILCWNGGSVGAESVIAGVMRRFPQTSSLVQRKRRGITVFNLICYDIEKDRNGSLSTERYPFSNSNIQKQDWQTPFLPPWYRLPRQTDCQYREF
jgi:hypothetical protein